MGRDRDDADAELAAVLHSRRPGYFDAVKPLVVRYVALLGEHRRCCAALDLVRLGSAESAILVERRCDLTEEICELVDLLHLSPGDRDLPPPRVQ